MAAIQYRGSPVAGLIFGLAAVMFAPGAAAESADSSLELQLLSLIGERLVLAERVAYYKWRHALPVEDVAFQRQTLQRMEAEAQARGVGTARVVALFRAQLAAADILQTERIAQWQAGSRPPVGAVPDFERDLRPALDGLGRAQVAALAQLQPRVRGNTICLSSGRLYELTYELEQMGIPGASIARVSEIFDEC